MNLDEYIALRGSVDQKLTFVPSVIRNVTILAYFYRDVEDYNQNFIALRTAILETWRHCGMMKTVLVVNKVEKILDEFVSKYGNYVSVRVSPLLKAGHLESMSIDCNVNLYKYFDTEYVLIIQDDGFPLRPGLEDFVGKWDYIGAPFLPSNSWIDFYTFTYPRGAVGNGGFSLRSRKICEMASWYYGHYYKWLPYIWSPDRVNATFVRLNATHFE